ncbi:hypothetical protein F5Y10DRAFT_247840 [Nemania abortiva]|nr:hypothetical protein F5Y10DRAFT_247840 [Nemania abortiva]
MDCAMGEAGRLNHNYSHTRECHSPSKPSLATRKLEYDPNRRTAVLPSKVFCPWNKPDLPHIYPSPPQDGATNTRHKRNRLLWLATATLSLLSSFPTGVLLASYATQSSGHFWRTLRLPFREGQEQCLETLLSPGSTLETLRPLPQLMCTLHIFCLSTLALHRGRKYDRYQNETIGLIVVAGLSFGLCTLPVGPCRATPGTAIMILPILISIGVILSTIFHTIHN